METYRRVRSNGLIREEREGWGPQAAWLAGSGSRTLPQHVELRETWKESSRSEVKTQVLPQQLPSAGSPCVFVMELSVLSSKLRGPGDLRSVKPDLDYATG